MGEELLIRVLQCVNDMHRAGLETMLMNYYRHIDRNKIQFDFLTHRPYRSDYDDEIEALGGRIYYAPRLYPQNFPKYFRYMRDFFKEHPEYKIVHSHIDSMSFLPLLAAKKAGVPVRIAHSHNTSIDRDMKYFLKQYFRFQIPKVANYFCACGKEAGEFLFGSKKFQYIPNAIEVDRFLYDPNVREKKRRNLGWDGHYIIGHVGRLSYQKNHDYLVKIFKEISMQDDSALLVLIGVGEKEEEIRKLIEKLGLTKRVVMLGNRSDVNELYQAMDVFVMPSFFEGIPVVGIEAQFAGLPCVFSDKVPKQVKFAENVKFISLKESEKEWARNIMEYKGFHRKADPELALNSEYNIKNACLLLENYYMSFYGEKT
nr:glycosyltransferase family 1 protein [Gemmiger formicilis]